MQLKLDFHGKEPIYLQIVEQVSIIAPPEKHREKYLATKRDKLGHLLPPEGKSK